MAALIVPAVAEVKWRGTNDGLPWVFGVHVQADPVAGNTPINGTALASLLSQATLTGSLGALLALMPTTSELVSAEVRDISVGGTTASVAPIGLPGTGTGDGLASSTAVAIEFLNPPGSASVRNGKIFAPAVLKSSTLSDQLASGVAASYNVAYENILSALTAAAGGSVASFTLGWVSRENKRAGRLTPLFIISSSPVQARAKVATQVRRLRGGKHKR